MVRSRVLVVDAAVGRDFDADAVGREEVEAAAEGGGGGGGGGGEANGDAVPGERDSSGSGVGELNDDASARR